MNFNEKRPERVLMKGANQEVTCPSCKASLTLPSNLTSATCKCGQVINWSLRKA